MKKDCFVFDCDEVLLDHMGGLYKFVLKYYPNIIPKTFYPNTYDLCDWLGCSQENVQEIIRHFNQNSYEFGLLEPIGSSTVLAMKNIRKKYPNAHIVVLTKSGTFGHGEVLRKVNIINKFGNDIFDDIIIIEMYESKKGELYKLSQNYNVRFLVDDYIGNIDVSRSLGIPSIMFACMHNLNYANTEDFYYAGNWRELPVIIDNIMKGE